MLTTPDGSSGRVAVRSLTVEDLPAFLGLIDALADYERLARPDAEAKERLARDATSDPPRFRVLVAEREGKVIGCGSYFFTYSTFLARPTLWVEDLFVLPEARGNGAGRALMRALAREAVAGGCGRMEWTVLDWNSPAIALYEGIGARILNEWRVVRLSAEQVGRLAEDGPDR
jgi:GNAT superfamily N-acetyltransferase